MYIYKLYFVQVNKTYAVFKKKKDIGASAGRNK